MKDVTLGPEEWEAEMTHERCGTSFTAETTDVKVDEFKKSGTYWFDSSADAAGLDWKFFVNCPLGDGIVIVEEDLPVILTDRLKKEALEKKV